MDVEEEEEEEEVQLPLQRMEVEEEEKELPLLLQRMEVEEEEKEVPLLELVRAEEVEHVEEKVEELSESEEEQKAERLRSKEDKTSTAECLKKIIPLLLSAKGKIETGKEVCPKRTNLIFKNFLFLNFIPKRTIFGY